MISTKHDDSFIRSEEQSGCLKFAQKLDFFSFIPVPKDEPVSTRRSLLGSVLFIVLFLTFIIIDFYQFVTDNPPIIVSHASSLDDEAYTLPRFAIGFMSGETLN